MKFAHIRVSEYFTFAKQIFHSEAISLARRANFAEKRCVNVGKNSEKVCDLLDAIHGIPLFRVSLLHFGIGQKF